MNYRQRCGVGLICVSCAIWGSIFLLPLSGMTMKWQVGSGAILYVLNYFCFFVGVWLLGKKMWQGFKTAAAKFFSRSKADESES